MTPRPTPNLEGQVLFLVCPLLFDLSGLVNPARGIKTPAGIALRIMEAHKLPHHGKVATLGAGLSRAFGNELHQRPTPKHSDMHTNFISGTNTANTATI